MLKYSRQECEDQGGTESGSCADGKQNIYNLLGFYHQNMTYQEIIKTKYCHMFSFQVLEPVVAQFQKKEDQAV